MTETVVNRSPLAPPIEKVLPFDRGRARAAAASPRRPSAASGDNASETRPRPPFERIALVRQGGGALGAYQAGVYEALAEAALHPDWIAGISIGAINGALIAENAPEARGDKLRAIWMRVTADPLCDWSERLLLTKDDAARQWLNQMSAYLALAGGPSGFFTPRFPAPWLHPSATADATSVYDTNCLKATLEQLIDFDRINARFMWLNVGAVNVRSGNFIYFDTATHIGAEHIMASAALPPGFSAVEIEGEHYWGRRASLEHAAAMGGRQPSSSRQPSFADRPSECAPRASAHPSGSVDQDEEIRYSSRTDAGTDSLNTFSGCAGDDGSV